VRSGAARWRYTSTMRVQRLSTAQHRGILVTWRAHPIPWATLGGYAWLAFVAGCTALAIHYGPSLLAGFF